MEQILNFVSSVREYDYSSVLFVFKVIGFIASVGFALGIIYAAWKLNIVSRGWMGRVFGEGKALQHTPGRTPELVRAREKWEKLLEYAASDDESQRKIAVISADALLDQILKMSGYEGENLGERLKKVERGDITYLDELWEAHKARNRVAHEAGYALSKEDALKAMTNYGKVLRELKYL